jgi:amino acid transporter/nucleotide-binding universal stress UspA family protein
MDEVRRLEREFGLGHAILLGAGGTIAASIFVLTGAVAERLGPASVALFIVLGVLNVSVALNYAELATTYPVTGGALTYVRKAYGNGLLAFLVGSLDTLSGTFYAALSAMGFAYSLEVIVPGIPIVPTAIVVIGVFTLFNVLGTDYVGRAQQLLGGVLLTMLGAYIAVGFLSPTGFSWDTFVPRGEFVIHDSWAAGFGALLGAFTLVFNAFVGFEIIADDAEEFKSPNRTLPLGILISLAVVTLIYVGVVLVTLGTLPWFEIAGSNQALSDAAGTFLPRFGPPVVSFMGIIATLTSCNTAILAATHEALTLGRQGLWPAFMSRLGRLRTPYAAALTVGALAIHVASIGVVEFLGYITSTGYLFVVFWASLAMVRLHDRHPDIERPFQAPLFPLTPYIAAGVSAIAIAFASTVALAFLGGLLFILAAAHVLHKRLAKRAEEGSDSEKEPHRLLLAVDNPSTAGGLARLAASLSEEEVGTPMEILNVASARQLTDAREALEEQLAETKRTLLSKVEEALEGRNVPFYTEVRKAADVSSGILEEISDLGDIRLLVMGWPGDPDSEKEQEDPVASLLEEAPVDMAVFMGRDIVERPQRILVPFGGGVHAQLALKLATRLVAPQEGEVTALRCVQLSDKEHSAEEVAIEDSEMTDVAVEELSDEQSELHDELMLAHEEIEAGLGRVPDNVNVKVLADREVAEGARQELMENDYDLVVIGAALAHSMQSGLFGSLTSEVAKSVPTSVLLVRQYEPEPVTWTRRQLKQIVESAEESQS